MNKYLVRSEEEYMAIFNDSDPMDVEEIVGIEFAYSDGTFQSDLAYSSHVYDIHLAEGLPLDTNQYRKYEECNFPESYPCIVLFANEKSFDRTGSVQFKMLEFVHLEDFNQ